MNTTILLRRLLFAAHFMVVLGTGLGASHAAAFACECVPENDDCAAFYGDASYFCEELGNGCGFCTQNAGDCGCVSDGACQDATGDPDARCENCLCTTDVEPVPCQCSSDTDCSAGEICADGCVCGPRVCDCTGDIDCVDVPGDNYCDVIDGCGTCTEKTAPEPEGEPESEPESGPEPIALVGCTCAAPPTSVPPFWALSFLVALGWGSRSRRR